MADKTYKIKIPLSDGTVKELLFTVPQGEKGDPGVDITGAEINSEGHLIITMSNGNTIDTGIAKGKDGFTPSIQVVPDASGWQINFINDNFQTDSIHLEHGYSPQVRVGEISGGHRVYITAKYTSGETYEEHFDVMDGEDGKPPAVSIEDIDGGHRVTIGDESFDVMNGRDGDGGGSGLIHILDGAADGSVRTSGASAESASYKLGRNAFAEGSATKASGYYSHAEGSGTVASNYAAHAEGTGTIAAGEDQHVQGAFNVEDADSKYLHIVGNGTSNTDRSNAHTIDRDGNAWFRGKVFVGGTGQDDPNAKELGGGSSVSWNDLTDKPFYEGMEYGVIIPETALEFPEGQAILPLDISILNMIDINSTYDIVWNGTKYTCSVVDASALGGEGYVFGNIGALMGEEGTGEPFIAQISPYSEEECFSAWVPLDGSTTATAGLLGERYTVKQLDEKFIPPNVYYVDIDGYISDPVLVNGSHEGVMEAFKAGKTVYLRNAGAHELLATLSSYASNLSVFSAYTADSTGILVRVWKVYDNGNVECIFKTL